jgi:hypothetical protein
MALVYRSMLPDGSGLRPQVGNNANSLGVRYLPEHGQNQDVPVKDGIVQPGRHGMSVSSSPDCMPFFRIPKRFKGRLPEATGIPSGNNRMVCWQYGDGPFTDSPFAEGLHFLTEPAGDEKHGVVSPAVETRVESYCEALAATRFSWCLVAWPWEGAES